MADIKTRELEQVYAKLQLGVQGPNVFPSSLFLYMISCNALAVRKCKSVTALSPYKLVFYLEDGYFLGQTVAPILEEFLSVNIWRVIVSI